MTIKEIYEQLNKCLGELNEKNIDDDAKLDLELLVIHLNRQIRSDVFNPLKDINNVTVADLSRLSDLVGEVEKEIGNAQKRSALVIKVIGLAKMGLKAAGLPIPS